MKPEVERAIIVPEKDLGASRKTTTKSIRVEQKSWSWKAHC